MNKILISLLAVVLCGIQTFAQNNFERWFDDSTLRLDYVFGGDSARTDIYLDGITHFEGWYGRRVNLSSLPLLGNGQLFMADIVTGDTIYANSFTSLFLEWLATPESRKLKRSFEHVMLVPCPKNEVRVTIQLRNMHQDVIAHTEFALNPNDILIRRSKHTPLPHSYIGERKDPRKVIDIAILPEGYTADEMAQFHIDAERAAAAITEHEPFSELRDLLNFVVVDAPSTDSGCSLPRNGVWNRTACGSHFDTFYTERYNTTGRLRDVHTLLENIAYEHILILTNTDIYGGGGFYNDYCIASAHAPWTEEVIVHEFGHSFGGLADEYATDNNADNYYPSDIEPWEQNITTKCDFKSKWNDLLDKTINNQHIGLYEGAGYQTKDVFRPVENCRMRVNNVKDFCPVCQRAISRMIRFHTEQISCSATTH